MAVVAVDSPDVDRRRRSACALGAFRSSRWFPISPAPKRDHFAGVDNIAAGRTAGSLMGRFLGGRAGPVAVLAGSMLVRDHRERLEGFRAVMAEAFPAIALLPVIEGQDDPDTRRAPGRRGACRASPGIVGIYSLGAGNRGLIARAEGRRRTGAPICVIAHELTPHTRAALQSTG